jgi:hypothetical protein
MSQSPSEKLIGRRVLKKKYPPFMKFGGGGSLPHLRQPGINLYRELN